VPSSPERVEPQVEQQDGKY
jgi:hypothetical protein